jgi:hypothetical protein
MKSEKNAVPNITVTNSGNGPVSVAVNDSTSIQQNHESDREQLITLLNEILSEIDPTIPEHRQLSDDVNEILKPLNRNKMPPEQEKNWLQDGLEKIKLVANLKTGTGLITLVDKVYNLVQKMIME